MDKQELKEHICACLPPLQPWENPPYQVFELDDLHMAVQDLDAVFELTRRFLHEYSIQLDT